MPGDTLASALLANGVSLVGRSFKYHRPRGILTAGLGRAERAGRVARRRAARAEHARDHRRALRRPRRREPEPLAVAAPSTSGGQRLALAVLPGRASTTRPSCGRPSFWEKLYEPLIRRAAGLGRAAPGGRSRPLREGIRALRRAGDRRRAGRPDGGARGGARRRARHPVPRRISGSAGGCSPSATTIDGMPMARMGRRDRGRTRGAARRPHHAPHHACSASTITGSTARSSASTIIVAEPPPHQPRQRFWQIVAKRAVLAAGAIERPIVFGNNDRPGVMLAGAVRTYINRFAAAPASRLVGVHQQ